MEFIRKSHTTNAYTKYYSDLNYDRAGLFELIKEKYGCSTVLYPGCSIHITPSFYFQHVVYVDISDAAREFFQDTQNILGIVNSSKKYKQSAYIQFIDNDYTKPLSVRENHFDLLIAIYAGGITTSCNKYVRPGGTIVTNNHHGDATEASEDPSLMLEALIRKRGKKYRIEESADDNLLIALNRYRMPLKNMKNSNNGLKFVDNDYYFVFRKLY